MNDQAADHPLIDLLRRAPRNARVSYKVGNGFCNVAWGELFHRAADALGQAQERAIIDNQEKITAVARITYLEAALKVYEDIVSESRGVDGWHLNGDIAEWDEFDLPEITESVLTAGESDPAVAVGPNATGANALIVPDSES